MAITRRVFLWSAAIAGAGLAVGLGGPRALRYVRNRRRAPPLGTEAWMEIGPDERVRLHCNATEMGQGAWTALAQIACEELEADWSKVVVAMAPVQREFRGPLGYGTGGSQSVRSQFEAMRRLGAAARVMLVEAAAREWGVPAGECTARLGTISHSPTGRTVSYGAVAAKAAALAPPADPPFKKREAWTLIGRSLARLDSPAKVDGSARFGLDVRLPGMRFAAIAHCPVAGGKLKGIDSTRALAVAGVEKVVTLEDAVAVIATDTWTAARALASLVAEWNPGPNAAVSSTEARKALLEAAGKGGGEELSKDAQAVAPAFRNAAARVSAIYEAPLIAHAQLEPMNATAWHRDGGIEIWAPTQQQAELRDALTSALGLPEERITIHTPFLGGGFGRRLENDYALEAARIAKQSPHPVQVMWSREDDFRRGVFRTAAAARLSGALDAGGRLVAIEACVASLDARPRVGGLRELPYAIAARSLRYAAVPRGVRIGSWRSVDASQNIFFLESFIDECAAGAKRDPLAFRLDLLSGNARARRVLESVAELSGWEARESTGRHLGLAFCVAFDSLVAQVAEAAVVGGKLRITRIFAAVDCGTAVNPRNIAAQIGGAILMAFSAALAEEITLEQGQVRQTGYEGYPVLRMAQAPAIEVRVLETPEAPIGGIGEAGVPPAAAAVANAVFAATGVRVRTLPMCNDTRVQWLH
jgi:isoquinoline 1-oxidoreductase beta subunit